MIQKTKTLKNITYLCAAVTIGIFMSSLPDTSTTRPSTKPSSTSPQTTTKSDQPVTKSVKESQSQSAEKPGQLTSTPVKMNASIDRTAATFQLPSGEIYPLRTYKLHSINDPGGNQWWTGSTGLDIAWNVDAGPRQTTVAVIDTGFALTHEEFSGRWAENSGEKGVATVEESSDLNCTDSGLSISLACNLIDDDFDGIVDNETGAVTTENTSRLNCTDRNLPLDKSCNMVDDDGNGYIDDVTGWDFVNNDASVQAGETNPDGDGVRHGTEVTGILAATGNNGKGIAGVDWNTKVLPLQALNDDSYGNTLTISRAIVYATDRGVDVINISAGANAEDPYLRQAIHYALDRNTIVVAASGNDGCDCITYPARYPEVVAVGAQSPSGNRSFFSSYGSAIDILAPGENITTPSWSSSAGSTGYSTGIAGTSFSAPYVSGMLSLARSHQPDAQWGDLLHTLLATADHDTLTNTNSFSTFIGSGYAQANNFMTRLQTPAQPVIRYIFWPTPIRSTLSSSLSYQCMDPSDFPTAPLYEITSVTSTFYSIDELEHVRAMQRGSSVTSIGRTCVGLPTDTPSTIRHINLLSEIKNIQIGKNWQG